ncbi:similar to Saccharomyces cerevisiae YBL032W HEK2 RNA binding protein involved in the asymmetric localization of ASH1 mRNA [Maudiozyma saulgeensis]|uniref:Similar to Saccharomyces cerevisiae YBL032W HEK2 RNA binding protein involved in the asymmetric localization of ASH1 mRNA n=1 Tax=Maudiozyma saulgeensis TaxID=1789683 RepID=A0A1X7R856_9SACH|nr:similar to Saccharomyces cerevisiae YBL032W HEK2 RNA binding protein involved in the asymmetric localization of ASH1 mRNA [Kazachstania saulgeensis]
MSGSNSSEFENETTSGNSNSEYDYDTSFDKGSSNMFNEIEKVSDDLPTYQRFMLSLDECGRIFGPQGQYLRKIKQDNHVKIDVTEKQIGCSDRILTCAGTIQNISQAMTDIVTLLISNQPIEIKKYPFYFLNSFLPPPELTDFNSISSLNEIYNIRVILTNTQISSIIGKQGRTIRHLIDSNDVKIVASRNFLPDSDERILQIQGPAQAIGSTIDDIAKTLNAEINIDQITERHYFPHVLTTTEHKTTIRSSTNTSNIQRRSERVHEGQFQATVLVPDSLVGAMMGTRGNRISNLRKFTHTRIDTGKMDDLESNYVDSTNETFRKFIISGDNMDNVKKAESLLNSNLENEIKRREEAEINDN